MMKNRQPLLGILTDFNHALNPPFMEEKFFKILSLYGHANGLNVIVFSPRFINWKNRVVFGYRYHPQRQKWEAGRYPIPSIIYDRLFYSDWKHVNEIAPVLRRLRSDPSITWLNRGLPGKWKVYMMLKQYPHITPFLPDTILFGPGAAWKEKLLQEGALFLKPSTGSQGKGVLKISLGKKKLTIVARNPLHPKEANRLFVKSFSSSADCQDWLQKYIGTRRYIVQPYLPLRTPEGTPFDMRILVQKNGQGKWDITGRAIRLGPINALTANLHGGGRAVDATLFLREHYPPVKLQEINHHLAHLTASIPQVLEKKHGPLCELGIDIGIEPQGKVWLLEVNSKPGRRSFAETGDKEALRKALTQPVHYANFVLANGRSIQYG
jgi:hypothetical protein